MKKSCANFLILNLLLSVAAFGIITGAEVLSTSPLPHGPFSSAVKSLGGEVGPKGAKWIDKSWVEVASGGQSGIGYSMSGILEGAAWAAGVGLAVYSIAGLLGEDDEQAKAWGTAADG